MAAPVYDMITIGGPASLTAGLNADCARFQTIPLAKLIIAGRIRTTDLFNNYSGFPDGITGKIASNASRIRPLSIAGHFAAVIELKPGIAGVSGQ